VFGLAARAHIPDAPINRKKLEALEVAVNIDMDTSAHKRIEFSIGDIHTITVVNQTQWFTSSTTTTVTTTVGATTPAAIGVTSTAAPVAKGATVIAVWNINGINVGDVVTFAAGTDDEELNSVIAVSAGLVDGRWRANTGDGEQPGTITLGTPTTNSHKEGVSVEFAPASNPKPHGASTGGMSAAEIVVPIAAVLLVVAAAVVFMMRKKRAGRRMNQYGVYSVQNNDGMSAYNAVDNPTYDDENAGLLFDDGNPAAAAGYLDISPNASAAATMESADSIA